MTARHDRQSFLGMASEASLGRLCVAIVGLGGGGSHIAQQLAHVGVGRFILFDPDQIEESNLNRLIGATAEDVHNKEYKVNIAQRMILGVNPSAMVLRVQELWQDRAEILRNCDTVFGCVDTFAGRDQLERVARRYLVPYIDIGLDVHLIDGEHFITGQSAVSMPGKVCLRCMNVLREDLLAKEAANYGNAGGRPQVVWPNGVLASTAVGMMISLITPWSAKNPFSYLVEYDGNTHEMRKSPSSSFLETVHCPHFVSLHDLGDPWFSTNARDSHHPRESVVDQKKS